MSGATCPKSTQSGGVDSGLTLLLAVNLRLSLSAAAHSIPASPIIV
jgi:hypothetical protein